MFDSRIRNHRQTPSQTTRVPQDTSNMSLDFSANLIRVHFLRTSNLLDDETFQANPKFAVDLEIAVSICTIIKLMGHRSEQVQAN